LSYRGGDRAEFGIIEDIYYEKDYSDTYEPERCGCVAICDDALNDWWDGLVEMPSYFHSYSRPKTALARWGVTLIPPSSLGLLIDVIRTTTQDEFQADAFEIVTLLEDAKSRGKFVIHYGI
jgi:hypothetical protein